MNRIIRCLSLAGAAASLIAPLSTVHAQQKDGKPTVAILVFENGAFGKSAKDFDGLSKGVPGFLITEMQANLNIRVIERDQVQRLVDEHKLVSSGHVDPSTAAKIGKMLGAHHMIFGTFMSDPQGRFRIDARAVNVESGEVEYVERVQDKEDNVMALIGQLAAKLNSGMKLPAPPSRTGNASPGSTDTPSATPKLPMRVAVMYGKALDLKDHGENKRAIELLAKVLSEFPNYEPAKVEKKNLGG